jgi:hypothetical protein
MKSKEQKREEARQRQNAHGLQRVEVPVDMPYLCGGYTQTDWDLLVKNTDWEYFEYAWDGCRTLEEQYDFLTEETLATKPWWA